MKTKIKSSKQLNELTQIVLQESPIGIQCTEEHCQTLISDFICQEIPKIPEMTDEDTGMVCDLIEEDYLWELAENFLIHFEFSHSYNTIGILIEELEIIKI